MRRAAFILLACLATVGCRAPNTLPLEEQKYASIGKVLFVGTFYDHRTRETVMDEGAEVSAARLGEVRIPASEIRSVFASSLASSNLFKKVVNPPAEFAGTKPDEMIANAQKSSDYLLIGEVNQFHVKSLGFNAAASYTLPVDILITPISLVVYAMSAGTNMIFTGGVVATWTAEAVLSVSVSLIDPANGKIVLTERLEERVEMSHDGRDAFGVLWDETDDWLDLGRRLGELALHNAGIHLAERLNRALRKVSASRDFRESGDGGPSGLDTPRHLGR